MRGTPKKICGESSRLYQALVYRDQIAQSIEASQSSYQLTSIFQIEAVARPGVTLEQLQKAIDECYAAGYLGQKILGKDFSLNLYLHRGAAAYICGEETALINSLEGRRANPRARPDGRRRARDRRGASRASVRRPRVRQERSSVPSHGGVWSLIGRRLGFRTPAGP
mgnify:CR=1 FL=1